MIIEQIGGHLVIKSNKHLPGVQVIIEFPDEQTLKGLNLTMEEVLSEQISNSLSDSDNKSNDSEHMRIRLLSKISDEEHKQQP
jgi:hypothetical protein